MLQRALPVRLLGLLSVVRTSSPSCMRSVRAFSALATSPSIDLSPRASSELPVWAGGDVEIVVHESLSSMAPCDLTTISGRIFNAPVRTDLVHRTVVWQLACRRQGTAKTKNRSEVSGSGKKIRPQKGSGRSRQGARTSPIFRGGGRAHGPVPRDYSFTLPKNVRRAALSATLTSKFLCGQLWIVDDIHVPEGKTKSLLDMCQKLMWRSVLVIDHLPEEERGVDPTFCRASHVVQPVLAMNVQGLNVYDALSFDMLVLTRRALQEIEGRYAEYDQFV